MAQVRAVRLAVTLRTEASAMLTFMVPLCSVWALVDMQPLFQSTPSWKRRLQPGSSERPVALRAHPADHPGRRHHADPIRRPQMAGLVDVAGVLGLPRRPDGRNGPAH